MNRIQRVRMAYVVDTVAIGIILLLFFLGNRNRYSLATSFSPCKTKRNETKMAKRKAAAKATTRNKKPLPKDDPPVVQLDSDSEPEIDPAFSTTACVTWFQKYATKTNPGRGKVAAEYVLQSKDMEKLGQAAGIAQNDVSALILSQKLGLANKPDQPIAVSQKSWMTTMTALECDSGVKLNKKLNELQLATQSRKELLGLCEYAFGFAKDINGKTVAKENAMNLFSVMLKSTWEMFPIFQDFFEKSGSKGLTLDTFSGVCDLANRYRTADDLKTYDSSLAWPALADEFVEFVQANRVTTEKMKL